LGKNNGAKRLADIGPVGAYNQAEFAKISLFGYLLIYFLAGKKQN